MASNVRSATEESVGCLCYANQEKGITGIIKHRYCDFHVHELDSSNNIIKLKSLEVLPEPEFPEGFLNWEQSNDVFFKFSLNDNNVLPLIYFKYPHLSIQVNEGMVTIERTAKKRPRPLIFCGTLYKENMNQQEALARISQKLNIPKQKIGIAGNKDKRAITTQMITLQTIKASQLPLLKSLHDKIRLGDIGLAMTPLSLGDHEGNNFNIVIRDISIPESKIFAEVKKGIEKRVNALLKYGFINYFGMQRFGSTSTPTYTLGKYVLQKNWKKVVDLILEPNPNEQQQVYEVKLQYSKTKDAKEAFMKLPKSCSTERAIFKKLMADPKLINRPSELFHSIERRQRMLYVHSYQSYIWNHHASVRIQKHGMKVYYGDIVVDPTGGLVIVNDSNINEFSIFDIVIPLQTTQQPSPYIKHILDADGITPEMFSSLHDLGLQGSNRRLFSMPNCFEWDLIQHDDKDAPLVDSDLDIMNGLTNKSNWVEGGKYTSLRVSFNLGSGQYATMVLRELIKRSTEWWTDSDMSNKKESKFRCEI